MTHNTCTAGDDPQLERPPENHFYRAKSINTRPGINQKNDPMGTIHRKQPSTS